MFLNKFKNTLTAQPMFPYVSSGSGDNTLCPGYEVVCFKVSPHVFSERNIVFLIRHVDKHRFQTRADVRQAEKFCLWRKLISCAKIFVIAKICTKFLSVEKLRRNCAKSAQIIRKSRLTRQLCSILIMIT